MIGLGIDTGGTYTDAVLYNLNTKEILCEGKALTTHENLEIGIKNALLTLDAELLKKASVTMLSTTLATNACVENKGARAKLLMLGFEWSMVDRLKEVYASYGFTDTDDFIIYDAKVENLFSKPYDPDWEDLKKNAIKLFGNCDSIGIVQKHPRANGARFEIRAREILKEQLEHPITIASEISDEIDILKCCAGTLLNARLIPLIDEFIKAVKAVLKEFHLPPSIAIVRSDGSLMSEEMARLYPVETLLCGPAASVLGGCRLSDRKDALIVDMGGTTTDVSLMNQGVPEMEETGISIGKWKTNVKGLFVDTFALGGDTAVSYSDRKLVLEQRRIIPVSVFMKSYPDCIYRLRKYAENNYISGILLHEFYLLQKEPLTLDGYNSDEQNTIKALRNGPLILEDLAQIVGRNPYYLKLDRLESQGIIIRSGLTPTDAMILKEDYKGYDTEGAELLLKCYETNTGIHAGEIPDMIYEMVIKRLYSNLARILLERRYKKTDPMLIDWIYNQKQRGQDALVDLNLSTELPLIGVGAPIHIFLPRAAALLGSAAIIPKHAAVANAVGAVSGNIVTRVNIRLKPIYQAGYCNGYEVYNKNIRNYFEEYEEAEKFAVEIAQKQVYEKAVLQGSSENPRIEIQIKKIKSEEGDAGILFETDIIAIAKDIFSAIH